MLSASHRRPGVTEWSHSMVTAAATSLSPSSLCLAFGYRQCECWRNGLLCVISHVPPCHMLSGQPHKLKQKLQMQHKKGWDNDGSSLGFPGLFPLWAEVHNSLSCIITVMSPQVGLSQAPSSPLSVNDTPFAFSLLNLEHVPILGKYNGSLHTNTFPWSPHEAEGGPVSLCLASVTYS